METLLQSLGEHISRDPSPFVVDNSNQDTAHFAASAEQVLRAAILHNWGAQTVETECGKVGLSEDHAAAVVTFWRSEGKNLREKAVLSSQWLPTLVSHGWRVDVPTGKGTMGESREPIALVELVTGRGRGSQTEKQEVVRFTMKKDGVESALAELSRAEELIAKLSS